MTHWAAGRDIQSPECPVRNLCYSWNQKEGLLSHNQAQKQIFLHKRRGSPANFETISCKFDQNHLQHVFQGLGRDSSIRVFEGRCKLIANWQNFSVNDGLSPTFGLENSWKKYDLLEPFGKKVHKFHKNWGNNKAMLVGIQRIESIQLCSLCKRGIMCKMFFLAPEQQIPAIVSNSGVF